MSTKVGQKVHNRMLEWVRGITGSWIGSSVGEGGGEIVTH
jgi:hypothetical protein